MLRLKNSFFERNAVKVAEDLLGCFLCRKIKNRVYRYKIVETEAYEGLEDKASHASRGKTKRNEIMFGKAGYWYVYFVYGMHYMLNIVCGNKGYPAAVLIRATAEVAGPARLTKALKIDKKLNGKKSFPQTGLWLEKRDLKIKNYKIKNLPRIGVYYAGPIWSKKLYRFVLS